MKARRCLQGSTRPALGVAALIVLLVLSGCQLFQVDPIAILSSTAVSGPAPLTIDFNLSYSMHPKGRPLSYELDFGDGSDLAAGTEFGIIVPHTYEAPGTFNAVLTVSDDNDRQASTSLTITVSDDGPPEGTEIGMTAPDFTAPTTDGGEFTLSEARGQVVVLDFWGAWCTPCKKSLPHLDDLVTTYGEDGLIGVLVSTDEVEQDTIDFLAQNGYTDFISIWEPGAKYTPIAELYGVLSGGPVGIPHTFVLDRQGVVRWVGHPSNLFSEIVEALL
jgi:peroxiredoxin